MIRKKVEGTEALAILDEAQYLHLALTDENGPYSVPISFAVHGKTILIHSGAKGRKYEALRQCELLGFSTVVEETLFQGDNACSYGVRFRSVCGTALPEEITSLGEKTELLTILARKYTIEDKPMPEKAVATTAVFQLRVQEIAARIKVEE